MPRIEDITKVKPKIEDIKRIRWTRDFVRARSRCGAFEDTAVVVHRYGFSKHIKRDKDPIQRAISGPDSRVGLTNVGHRVVDEILSMPGVEMVWVETHAITVRIADIYDWEDGFHCDIVNFLNEVLFNGKAEIAEQPKLGYVLPNSPTTR